MDDSEHIPKGILAYKQHLSIWDIACRWAGFDPKTTSTKNIPTTVGDLIGLILQAQLDSRIPVTKEDGISVRDWSWLSNWKEYVPQLEEFDGTEGHRFELYQKFMHDITAEHRALTEKHYEMLASEKYVQAVIGKLHVYRDDLYLFCTQEGITPPSFWFNGKDIEYFSKFYGLEDIESEDEETESSLSGEDDVLNLRNKLSRDQIDRIWARLVHSQKSRLICRQVASAMWKENPNRTIQSIVEDEVIQVYCGASVYGDKKTVREWIADLDPRGAKSKQGRPKSES